MWQSIELYEEILSLTYWFLPLSQSRIFPPDAQQLSEHWQGVAPVVAVVTVCYCISLLSQAEFIDVDIHSNESNIQ